MVRMPLFLTVDMFGARICNGDDLSLVHFKLQNFHENNRKNIYS